MRFIIGVSFLVLSSPAFAATYCVNSKADVGDGVAETNKGNCPDDGNNCASDNSGLCNLREAIHAANDNPGADNIAFNLQPADHTIALTAQLTVNDEIHIDGYTQSGSAVATVGVPAILVVVVTGPSQTTTGIELSAGSGASQSSVAGLVLQNFAPAISVDADNCSIVGNFLGTDATGAAITASTGNTTAISVGGSGNKIGTGAVADRNVISGNVDTGVDVTGSTASIAGNYIGIAASGTAPVLNGVTAKAGNHDGIVVEMTADATQIGGSAQGAGNVIAANANSEIDVRGSNVQIFGNFIGVTQSGNQPASGTLDFHAVGIHFEGAAGALGSGTVGGTAVGEPNVVAGHGHADGIFLDATNGDITISGNLVGLDLDQSVDANTNGITVSGQTAGAIALSHNVLSGNAQGVNVTSASNLQITNNLIGSDVTGKIKKGNAGRGVSVVGGTGVLVGDSDINHANIISGNGAAGVYVQNAVVSISHNYIGLGVDGSAMGNALQGIDDESAQTTSIDGNLISNNTGAGIFIADGQPSITQNFIGLSIDAGAASGNSIGILVGDSGGPFSIGGAGTGNTISGNNGDGIQINGVAGVSVYGNIIGADVFGTADVGNTGAGVDVIGVGAQIGDDAAGKGNVIAFNHGSGIVSSDQSLAIIALDNAIFRNKPIGIDLGGNGSTLGFGASGVLDYPTISAASGAGSSISVSGTLGTLKSQDVGLQFFATPACDTSGFGQAETVFGSDPESADPSGPGNFSVTFPSTVHDGYALTAIATSFSGGFVTPVRSSEISQCFTLKKIGTFNWQSTSVAVDVSDATAPLTILRTDGSLGAVSIDLSTLDGTALQGVDYSAATETVDFADGETEKNVALSLLPTSHPGTSVSFTVTLSNPQGGAALGPNPAATVTISDNPVASTGGSSGGTSGSAATGGSTGAASGGVVNASSGGASSTGGAAATTTNVGKKGCGCGAAPNRGEWLLVLAMGVWLLRRRST